MKKLWWIITVILIVAGWVFLSRRSSNVPPGRTTAIVPAKGNAGNSIAQRGTAAAGRTVVIQTGAERMSNAARCMLYIVDLSRQLPKEHGSDKPMVMAMAGVLFFHDCLMAKISKDGYITATTNELCRAFTNAIAPLGTNIPVELVEGFNHAFMDRNNIAHMTVDDQYREEAKQLQLAKEINQMDAAFKQAGITDAAQSDLKDLCLALCQVRTTTYLMYGPQSQDEMAQGFSDAAAKTVRETGAAEYRAMADSLDKTLKWRLTNMYGLDDSTAQRLTQALSLVPVTGFSGAGVQPPAFIQ